MRLLVDMNLSPEWVPFLASEGIEARHWHEVGDPRAPDTVLMVYARVHGFVVFTHDLDFGALLASSGEDGPSVFQMRTQDVLPQAVGREVVRTLRAHENALAAGAIVTLDHLAARVRVLLVRGRRPPS